MYALISLFAFIAFLTLGHLFVSITLKRFLVGNDGSEANDWIEDIRLCGRESLNTLLYKTDSTQLFTLICFSVFIALFWGWIPAALLIVVWHLFICINSDLLSSDQNLLNFGEPKQANQQLSNFLKNPQVYLWVILYLFSLFMFALFIQTTAHLLSQNSGALFFIAGVCIAAYWLITIKSHLLKAIAGLISVILGGILSNHLGLYIIGHWQPFSSVESFKIDSTWFYASLLLCLIYIAHNARKKNSEKNNSFAYFKRINQASHILNLMIVLCLIAYTIIARPFVDTPMHASTDNLPSYITIIATILFCSMANLYSLLQQTFKAQTPNDSNNQSTMSEADPDSQEIKINHKRFFAGISTGSLIASIIALIILFVYASGTGIGAWQTHFNSWSFDKPLINFFTIFVESITAAIVYFGLPETVTQNLVVAVLILNLLVFLKSLSHLCENSMAQIVQPCTESSEIIEEISLSSQRYNLIASIILILIMLITTIGLNAWIFLGVLSVSGVLIFTVDALESTLSSRGKAHPFIWLSTSIIILITLLTMIMSLSWFKANIGFALASIIIIAASGFAISPQVAKIVSYIKSKEERNSLNLADEDNDSA